MRIVLLFAVGLAPVLFADEASKIAHINELLDVTNAAQMQKQLIGQAQQVAMAQLRNSLPAADAERAAAVQKRVFALMSEQLGWEKMKPICVKAYADTFTEPEIDDILAFYKSPAGQTMIQKMPSLMANVMEQMQGQMASFMQQMKQMLDTETKAPQRKP